MVIAVCAVGHKVTEVSICLQEEAVQYVASTVDRLLIEQKQQGLKRVYVISTYVIGKERLLVAVHRQTGCKIGVTKQKFDTLKCLDLPGELCSQCVSSKCYCSMCSSE